MLSSVLRLLFVLFAKHVVANLLVIFRHVRKIEKSDYWEHNVCQSFHPSAWHNSAPSRLDFH